VNNSQVIIIGGGAAGIFGAIQIKELYPNCSVIVLEKTAQILTKVKISGGGRCNVTHHQFNPKELVKNYPRGEKELLGPFHFFQPKDMIEWLENRGVLLKVEEDGRMFPTTDSSQTIIDCFQKELKRLKIQVLYGTEMTSLVPKNGKIFIQTTQNEFEADAVLFATGSHPRNFEQLALLDIPLVPLVPSLFTFHLENHFLSNLSGTSFPYAKLQIKGTPFEQIGPVLITHVGLSGPCTLKLSAFAARHLKNQNYIAELLLNVDASTSQQDKLNELKKIKSLQPQKQLVSLSPFHLTKNTFLTFLEILEIDPSTKWGHIADKKLEILAKFCHEIPLKMIGKSTFKEEFVTAGGVDLKYINLKTMEHKNQPRLFFAGEVLNVDGITGGFNFQNAWTSAYLAACGMKKYIEVEALSVC
jgi:predicted Rossmann fold flavoprotein